MVSRSCPELNQEHCRSGPGSTYPPFTVGTFAAWSGRQSRSVPDSAVSIETTSAVAATPSLTAHPGGNAEPA